MFVTDAHISQFIRFLAAMKLLMVITVLLVLLGNTNKSNGVIPYQKIGNHLRFKSPIGLFPTLPELKKNEQPKPKAISPTFELNASASSKWTKIRACRMILILNNAKRWRKYCYARMTYGRM